MNILILKYHANHSFYPVQGESVFDKFQMQVGYEISTRVFHTDR